MEVTTKRCPYCKEEIQADAVKCRYCGEYMPQEDPRPANIGKTPPPPPDNYLVWAILVTIFCCLPFGIVSIVYSSKVDSAYAFKNYDEAARLSKQAKNWMFASLISGAVIGIIYFIYTMLFVGAVAAGSAPYYW